MKKPKFSLFVILTASSLLSSTANAAATCSGLVSQAYTDASGNVIILSQWRGDWTALCNLTTSRQGVEPQTCFAWFSQVQSAIARQKTIGLYYNLPVDQGFCTTMPNYEGTPAPFSVRTAE